MTGQASDVFKYSVVQQEPLPVAQQLLARARSADWYVFGFAATPLGRFVSSTDAVAFAKLYEERCEVLEDVPASISLNPSDFAKANSMCRVQWSQEGHTDGLVTEDVVKLFESPQPDRPSTYRTRSSP